MNFPLNYSIKYFKNNDCFPSFYINFSVYDFFFQKGFQKNVQDSIQMPDITKRNSNGHLILGNTGHASR